MPLTVDGSSLVAAACPACGIIVIAKIMPKEMPTNKLIRLFIVPPSASSFLVFTRATRLPLATIIFYDKLIFRQAAFEISIGLRPINLNILAGNSSGQRPANDRRVSSPKGDDLLYMTRRRSEQLMLFEFRQEGHQPPLL
jgi:hypothetical protein